MKSRKGFWDLQTIIIVLVVFIILFLLTNSIAEMFIHSGRATACLLSVKATASTRGTPTEALDLECFTNFVGKLKAKGSSKAEKKDYIMRWIADLMYEAWYQFGEGHYDVFSGSMAEKPAHCFISAKFKMAPDLAVTETEFLDFLKENHIKSKQSTYFAFLDRGLIWDLDEQKTRRDMPVIIVKHMNFKYVGEDWADWAEYYLVRGTAKLTDLDIYGLYDIFMESFEIQQPDPAKLYQNEDYAIVFFQVSDYYWNQHWIKKLIDAGAEALKVYEKSVPPARVFIAKYSEVADLGCDVLQG